jgi:hypothetical protein
MLRLSFDRNLKVRKLASMQGLIPDQAGHNPVSAEGVGLGIPLHTLPPACSVEKHP